MGAIGADGDKVDRSDRPAGVMKDGGKGLPDDAHPPQCSASYVRGANLRDPASRAASLATRRTQQAAAQAKYLANVAQGLPLAAAAKLAGVDPRTARGWRKSSAFVTREQEAEADGTDLIESMVLKAAPHDWRAAVELLRVRNPERWGTRVKNLNVNEDGPQKAAAQEKIAQRLAELAARLVGPLVGDTGGQDAVVPRRRLPGIPEVH